MNPVGSLLFRSSIALARLDIDAHCFFFLKTCAAESARVLLLWANNKVIGESVRPPV